MEVKKLDIFESIIIAILLYVFTRNTFSNLGVIPCIIFALGITAIFLLLYHERYIGVILNIATSILWTTLIVLFLSIFSIFHNNTWLLVIIGLGLLYLFLWLHGLNIIDLIKNVKTIKKSSDSDIHNMINNYNADYSAYIKCKEKLMPVFNNILSDPNAPVHIKTATSNYFIQMNDIEKNNKEYLRLAKRKFFFTNTLERMKKHHLQLLNLTTEFQNNIKAMEDGERRNQENQYKQSQQYTNKQTNTNTSYFNGCDSLDSLKDRYRNLCKVYHPDTGNGSQQEFVKIQEEFDRLKQQYN